MAFSRNENETLSIDVNGLGSVIITDTVAQNIAKVAANDNKIYAPQEQRAERKVKWNNID